MSAKVLQAGEGPIPGDAYLPADSRQLLWGRLPCSTDRPAAAVASGSTITIDTVSHEGLLDDQGADPDRFFGSHGVGDEDILDEVRLLPLRPHDLSTDGPHLITGPIEVGQARPGDLLAMTVLDTTRRVPYGVISNRHGRGALPGELPERAGTYSAFASVVESADGAAFGRLPLRAERPEGPSVSFPLRPFLGIMGVATAGRSRLHSVPPGPFGGNIDINLLTTGSTLYLPVQVPGALAFVGDPHFAQGDGEVALTAMEASLRVTLRLDVVPAAAAASEFGELVGPLAETADFLVPTGLDPDLDVALANCVRAALGLLEVRYGMDRAQAYAYLSAATDFNISQVVDLVKGVHARIRKSDFSR